MRHKLLTSLGLSLFLGLLPACGEDESKATLGIGDEPGYGFTPGAPLTVSQDWQWVALEGAKCQDGSDTGFFVQKGKVNRLVVYLEGGGACFNEQTCKLNPQTFNSGNEERRDNVAVMNDDTKGNPFAGWSKVFVGYCSGDVYTGVRTKADGLGKRYQQGFTNVGLMLERVVPTFPDVDDVVLSGSSAGGFGAAYNWLHVQEAFSEKVVTLLDDSGQPLGPDYIAKCQQEQFANLWGWEKTLPPGCEKCGEHISNIMPYYLSTFPDRRFSLMSYTQDSTIRLFFGFGTKNCMTEVPGIPGEKFAMGVAELGDNLSEYPNFALWQKEGSDHTFLIGEDLEQTVDGTKLSDWLLGAIDGGDNFKYVGP